METPFTAQRLDSLSDKLQSWRVICLDSTDTSVTKDALRNEARSFFQSLSQNTSIVTTDGVVLTTKKPAHEETIAKLIQELEPAFSSRHAARANALYLLCGAIEGIQSTNVSGSTTKLIGTFLIGHCIPIETETSENAIGHDEIVRDSALICLSALLKSRLAEKKEIVESICTKLDLAMQGIERRAAVAETEKDQYDHIRGGGLSILPRSRRSLCFDLLRSAVEGVRVVSDQYTVTNAICAKTRGNIAKFVSFSATCMHGESDPRCLMQLLDLLRAIQVVLAQFFLPTSAASFPARDVFDAVAPYYPVQFSPPPNDTHGITRYSLHTALMAVLCEVKLGKANGPDSNINLTTAMFLERISPPEDEDACNATNADILEGLQDLDTLLFPGNDTHCSELDESTLRALSIALFSAHAKASFAGSEHRESGSSNKTAAGECRNLVSKIAYQLEATNCQTLWNIFVQDTIRTQSSSLASAPQSNEGRASIAYLAALAACGGQRTLRSCLDICLPLLLDIVQHEAHDEERLAAAIYGIAAFFASSRVAIHRANSQAIDFHPHPLRAYSSAAFQSLCTVLDINDVLSPPNEPRKPKSIGVQIPAIRAMEAVLMASPQDHLRGDDLRRIKHFLDFIMDLVVSNSRATVDCAPEPGIEIACSRTLGTLLGRSLHDSKEADRTTNSICVIDEVTALNEHLRMDIFQQLLTSVGGESATQRFDRMVLALACSDSFAVSRRVVAAIVALLYDALKTNRENTEVKCYARTLSFVFRHGGPFASKSFHELSSPSVTSEDIVDIIGSSVGNAGSEACSRELRPNLDVGMSMLKLPATTEQLEDVAKACQQAYQLALQIRPAYEGGISSEHLIKLVDRVSQILPPLEDVDNINLCVSLPLLAQALMSCRRLSLGGKLENSDCVVEKLESIAAPLASYALSSEHYATARSAAVSCLCEIIRGCPLIYSEPLPSRIISETIVPSMQDALNCISSPQDFEGLHCKALFRDSLFLLGALGSVAACAGHKSEAADEVVRFLVEITCVGSSRIPLGIEVVDVTIGGKYADGQVVSAAAFGFMLSVDDAGPFWKQRLAHVALRHIDLPIGAETSVVNEESNGFPYSSPGVLILICHIVGSTRIGAFGKGAIKAIARQILGGLVLVGGPRGRREDLSIILPLMLAAMMKLLYEATITMSECVSLVVLALARLVKVAAKPELKEMQIDILVCQALAAVAQNYRGDKSLELCKGAVLASLDNQLNHPSRLLRQAAAYVRNEWSVV